MAHLHAEAPMQAWAQQPNEMQISSLDRISTSAQNQKWPETNGWARCILFLRSLSISLPLVTTRLAIGRNTSLQGPT